MRRFSFLVIFIIMLLAFVAQGQEQASSCPASARTQPAQGILSIGTRASHVAGSERAPGPAADYFDRGVERSNKGGLDGAIADFTKTIELDEAALALTQSTENKARLAETYYNRGAARLKDKRDLDGAIDDFANAITLNPKDGLAYRCRGLARQLKNDKDGADADFAKAQELADQLAKSLRTAIPLSSRSLGPPPLPEGIVAEIGDDRITLSMLSEKREKLAHDISRQSSVTLQQGEEEASKRDPELIAKIIKEQFIAQQVLRLKLSDEIERQLNHATSREGKDREQLRTQIGCDLVFIRMIGWKVYFNPNSTEVKRYFDTHPETFRGIGFENTAIRKLMFEEWKNAELVSELVRNSYINIVEPYRPSVLQQLTDTIRLASDIPQGGPIKTSYVGKLIGSLIGCSANQFIDLVRVGIGKPPGEEGVCADPQPPHQPSALDHYHRGVVRFEENDFNGAIKEFTKALGFYSDFARAYAGRAKALLMLGQDAKAEGDLKRAVQFDPSLKTQIEDEVNLIKHRRKTQ